MKSSESSPSSTATRISPRHSAKSWNTRITGPIRKRKGCSAKLSSCTEWDTPVSSSPSRSESRTPLTKLPTELALMVVSHLDLPSQYLLKKTSSYFHRLIRTSIYDLSYTDILKMHHILEKDPHLSKMERQQLNWLFYWASQVLGRKDELDGLRRRPRRRRY